MILKENGEVIFTNQSLDTKLKLSDIEKVEMIPSLLPGFDIYVDELGLYSKTYNMNIMANPIIPENFLIYIAKYGGPFGPIIVHPSNDRKKLNKLKLSKIYNDYVHNNPDYIELKEMFDKYLSQ